MKRQLAAISLALTSLLAAGETSARAKIAVLGASVSAGFAGFGPSAVPSISLADALREILPEVEIVDLTDVRMYRGPETSARSAIAAAARLPASVVVGLDLPFWFGFGDSWYEPGTLRALRLGKQRRGLAVLDGIRPKLIVADYPDLSGTGMSDAKRPTPSVLEELNTRLRRWAASRPDTTVLSWRRLLGDDSAYLQPDGFHLSEKGTRELAAVVARILRPVVRNSSSLQQIP